MKIIQPFSNYFVRFVQAYYPDPFIFAIVLTFIAFVVSLLLTDANMMTAVEAWGGGLSYLMTFTTQIALLLITCHALAHTDHARSLLLAFGRLPKSVFQCYVSVALITSVASLISGSLGLIAGALIAVETAREARKNNIRIHYPLLVASAYAGQQVWHMGYSSSAALMVATQDNPLANIIGGIIPVKETIFSSWNLTIALVSALSIAVFCALMHPGDNEIMEITDSIADKFDHDESDENPEKTDGSFAEKIDNQRLFSFLLGALLATYIINWFFTRGLDLNLNIVVWTFLCLGLILCRSAAHYVELVSNAVRTIGPIMLQFPFYAGLMGLMQDTGLVNVISDWFTSFSTSATLPFWAFISAGIVNMFIPSGGGQFVIQGPIFFESARSLNVDLAIVTMAIAYGDQWTNTLQPFWTLPILAITGLHMRQIMGFMFVIFIVTAICYGGGILLVAS